jgi:cytochrome c peroxidase
MSKMKWALVILAAMSVIGCTKKEPPAPAAEEAAAVDKEKPAVVAVEPILPLPSSVDVNMDKVLLGRSLYHDTILSGDGTIACVTCHSLDHGGAEPRKSSTGIRGQIGPINSPTVLNSGYNFVQFWDGRAKDLQEQAAGPVANPGEMGANWDQVVERLKKNKEYAAAFAKLYEDGVTQANTTDAIAEYEKSLITPRASISFCSVTRTRLPTPRSRAMPRSKRSAAPPVTPASTSEGRCSKRWAW